MGMKKFWNCFTYKQILEYLKHYSNSIVKSTLVMLGWPSLGEQPHQNMHNLIVPKEFLGDLFPKLVLIACQSPQPRFAHCVCVCVRVWAHILHISSG